MAKKTTKTTTGELALERERASDKAIQNGIIGVLLALFCVSITYSTAVVVMGTGQEYTPKIMVVPQALGALFIFLKKFTR